MSEKNMINALVCDLISKVTFDCDLFCHNQISSAEFMKRSKEYSKEFTESFASLIRCANEQDEDKDDDR